MPVSDKPITPTQACHRELHRPTRSTALFKRRGWRLSCQRDAVEKLVRRVQKCRVTRTCCVCVLSLVDRSLLRFSRRLL